jgi:phosphohistidine phosphatase
MASAMQGIEGLEMFVYLVHHADAVAGNVDHMRPLSSRGRAQAEQVAKMLAERGVKPAVIWHSGKLRARQTAEACWRAVNPFAEFAAVRGLQPDDDPDTMAIALAAEDRDVLIASHMPFLPALLHRLTTHSTGSGQAGRRDRLSAPFPLNGAVALERDQDRWLERWRVRP